MATQANLEKVQLAYISFFGRPADPTGLEFWADALDSGAETLESLFAVFEQSDEGVNMNLSNEEFVAAVYQQALGRPYNNAADADGTFWLDALNSGAETKASLTYAIAEGAFNGPDNTDKQAVHNKVDAAIQITAAVDSDAQFDQVKSELVDAVASVNSSDASVQAGVDAAVAAIGQTGNGDGTTFTLTESQDNITGTDKDDQFSAYVFDNQNTLQSGDMVDGGAGQDTLTAVVGNSQDFAMTPITKSVEVVEVRVQASATDRADNEVTSNNTEAKDEHAQIDAQEMAGVKEWWSVDSRANLVIEDVRTNSHETKIGVRNTDAGDVNYELYYDSQHITANDGTTAGSEVYLDLLDQLHAPAEPLKQHPYKTFSFDFDGQTYTVDGLEGPDTYAELEQLVEDQIAALGLSNSLEVTRIQNGFEDRNGVTGDRIVISSKEGSDVSVPASGSFTTGPSKNANGTAVDDVYFALNDQAGVQTPALTSTDIEVDNVGRGSKSGDLIIGNMSMSGDQSSGSKGIQQFDIEVDRNSWFNEIRSTADSLEVVNVTNISENDAEGDGSFRVDYLEDVRVFDASSMAGSVTLNAVLSSAVTTKYLDLMDDAEDQSADNSEQNYRDVTDKFFSYDMGANDDSLNLSLSSANMAMAGTVNREDFVLEVNGNNGDDSLTVSVDDYDANTGDHWYLNSKENTAVTVNGGAGNDTIAATGAGDFVLNGDAGDDLIFADNAGNKASWVVNASNTDLNDLDSNGTGTTGVLYGATVTVTLSGAGATDASGLIQPYADQNEVGFEASSVISSVTGDQATINQAIKDAINNDAVLSQLLVVKDGPAHTLVIESKIDGYFETTDLSFNVTAADYDKLTASEQKQVSDAYQLIQQDSTAVVNNTVLADTANAYDGNMAVIAETGSASVFESDNVINAGTGANDVVVLGTGAYSNDTVKFTGTGNGKVTIVNFDDEYNSSSEDTLDFSAYLTGQTSASGSTASRQDIADTYEYVNVSSGSANASADEILIINDFVGDASKSETWANMTAADLLNALKNNSNSYGNIDDNDIDVGGAVNNFVGNTVKNIVMVENDANQGEYKVFEVTSDLSAGVNDFTGATLISTVDLGASMDGVDTGNGGNTNPVYNLSASAAAADEGTTVTFTLNTTNVQDGDVAYTISGVDAADVTGGTLSGNMTISNGVATLDVALEADAATEGAETLQLTVAGESVSVTVNDTSTAGGNQGNQTDQSIDVGTSVAAVTLDASTGSFNYTDDGAVETNVIIQNFTSDDMITVSNAAGSNYAFGSNGTDLTITWNNNGTVNNIVLEGAPGADQLVFDEASFEAAIGFDAFQLI